MSAVVVAIVGVCWFCWPEPAIGPANFERICAGMSLADVEAVIGMPPGNYSSRPPELYALRQPLGHVCAEGGMPLGEWPDAWFANRSSPPQPGGCVQVWWGESHGIGVAFNESNQAVGWYLAELIILHRPGLFSRLRQWVRW